MRSGRPVRQLRPARAAVARLEDPASRHLERGADLPRRLASRPKGGIHNVGVVGIDDDVESADVLVLIENLRERCAAVEGAIDAALRVGAVRMAEHADEQPVCVPRIDGNRSDLLAVAQTEVRPGIAAVAGLVHAVADGKVGPLQALSAARIDDPRIAWRYRERADRAGWFSIEDRDPGPARVFTLPNAAVDRSDVKEIRSRARRRRSRRSVRRATGRRIASAFPGRASP